MTFNELAHLIRALHRDCGLTCQHGLADMTDEEVILDYATPGDAAGAVASIKDIREVIKNYLVLEEFDQYLIVRMFSYNMTEEERNLLDTRLADLLADTLHEFLMHRDAANLRSKTCKQVLERLLSNVKQYLVRVLKEGENI